MRALTPLVILLALAFASPSFAQGGEAKARASVTVMPFVALKDGGQAWVGKAVSDMVAQRLAASDTFDVLERDKLQAFIREMELQESGFTSPDALSRVGALAKVDRVIYGNYALDGKKISLNLMELDAKTQNIVQRAQTTGDAGDLPGAAEKLVAAFLQKRGSGAAVKDINFRASDSTPAIQHFYTGMDHYDNGRYQDAYAAFLLAARNDAKYLDARLWAGRMLEHTGETAQAVLAYEKLYNDAPAAVEGRDALFFAARLLEEKSPDKSVAHYKTLANLMPRVPESLEASFRMAGVLEKQGKHAEAYKALLGIQSFREFAVKLSFHMEAHLLREERRNLYDALHGMIREARRAKTGENDPRAILARALDIEMRNSRFFNWDDALSLYRGAVLRMVGLYRKAKAEAPELEPPRGAFAVDPENPVIGEQRFGEKKSLFFDDEKYVPQWKENFYAAIVPEGYVATGVTLQVTGRVPTPSPTRDFTLRVFGFPLVKNYFNKWLGVIYGQTQEVTSLKKEIPFHGIDRDVLVFQLIENHGEIANWNVSFRLRKTEEGEEKKQKPAANGKDYPGMPVARLPLQEDVAAAAAEPQYMEQYGTKKRLAFARSGKQGFFVVAAKGSLSAGDTDLWAARSEDGKTWQPLAPMDVNSQSNDFSPQLVTAEDGGMRLFWISDRRGLGWELWTSALEKDGKRWSQPNRVPFRNFVRYEPGEAMKIAGGLLDYAAMQDAQGRWLLAAPSTGGGITVLSSADGLEWKAAGAASFGERLFNPALFQDASGVYWMAALDGEAMLRLMRSTDLQKWTVKSYALGSYSRHWSSGGNGNYGSLAQIAGFPVRLFNGDNGGLTLLFSDSVTGLQYASFTPETQEPAPDLVRAVTMEPYDAVKLGRGDWMLAAWQGDDIIIRRYKTFAFPENAPNAARDPLYHETETDELGNRWDRRIARTRYVMPDVTAVGAAEDGRAWWGIETGVMSLKGTDFYVADVSMGFFYHQATDIVPCGTKTFFASRSLARPVVGVVSSGWFTNKTDKISLPTLKGSITAIACAGNGEIYVGTSGGDVAYVKGAALAYQHHVEDVRITAVAASSSGGWAGTSSGNLYHFTTKGAVREDFQTKGQSFPVAGISVNGETAWVATSGGGVYRKASAWQQFTPENSGFPYAAPGKIKAAGEGLWIMPDAYTLSQGIGYFDGRETALFNPPSHNLFDMVDFDLAPDGGVWVGSESTGIYRLERAKP